MKNTITAAMVLAALSLATLQSAEAGGGYWVPNGVSFNGIGFNGVGWNGRGFQGTSVDCAALGLAEAVVSVELADGTSVSLK